MRETKAQLRTAALSRRDALGTEERAAAAEAIARRGLPVAIKSGAVVAGYSPIRNEVDPVPLMQTLAAQGARLALPVVPARGKSLIFRAWSRNDRLMLGPLGIPEPSPAAAELVPDIVLVPLAAFDRAGHRIGYGAGHYDFTLAHLLHNPYINPARLRRSSGAIYPRGLIDPSGNCPWPGPWTWAYGAHLLS